MKIDSYVTFYLKSKGKCFDIFNIWKKNIKIKKNPEINSTWLIENILDKKSKKKSWNSHR